MSPIAGWLPLDDRPDYLDDLIARFTLHVREGEWEVEVHLPTWTSLFRCDDAEGWVWFRSGEMNDEIRPSQIVLLDWLIDEQDAIGTAMRDAVLQAMPKIRARFEEAKMGPLPSSDTEVFEMTQLVSVYAHHVAEGSALLAVEIRCDWDEHGIGVLWRDGAVLGVSDGDAAMTAWMAERAARGDLKFLYPLNAS